MFTIKDPISAPLIVEIIKNKQIFGKILFNLEIGNNTYDDLGVHVSQLLEQTHHIHRLKLYYINDNCDEYVLKIGNALKVNTSLKLLILISTDIGINGAKAISDALKVNTTLQCLYIYGMSQPYIINIIDGLKTNNAIYTLTIGHNNIDSKIAEGIWEMLKVNTSLKTLLISMCDINSDSIKFIAEALKVNTTLKTLNVNGNSIGENGATYIAEALKVNKTLKELFINDNIICIRGGNAIVESVKVNKSFEKLHISNNHIGIHSKDTLKEIAKTRKNCVLYL